MFLRAVFDHAPEIRAVVVGPRHRTVDISIHDEDIVRFCIVLANAKLPFDGLFVLFVAGISRVNRCHIFLWTLVDFAKYKAEKVFVQTF